MVNICMAVLGWGALNRNIGRFNLHHIWAWVPLNTPGLKINGHANEDHQLSILSPPNLTPPFITLSIY